MNEAKFIEDAKRFEKEKQIKKCLGASLIPKRIIHADLDTFPTQALRTCYESFENLAEKAIPVSQLISKQNSEWPKRGIVITGRKRTGKTFLACAMLKRIIQIHARPGYFVNVNELFKQLQWAMDRPKGVSGETSEELTRRFTEVEYLVIDDIAAYRPSSWAMSEFYYLINSRFNELKFTIITSDIPLENYKNTLPQDLRGLFERIQGRVDEMCGKAWELPQWNGGKG